MDTSSRKCRCGSRPQQLAEHSTPVSETNIKQQMLISLLQQGIPAIWKILQSSPKHQSRQGHGAARMRSVLATSTTDTRPKGSRLELDVGFWKICKLTIGQPKQARN